MENTIALGIDIGGSHITAALVDLNSRNIVTGSFQREFVDSKGPAAEILDSWCAVINKAFEGSENSNRKIGIAMPGPFDYEAGISLIQDQEKFRSLYKLNLKTELGNRLGLKAEEISFINDAAAFLQGEVFCGAAAGSGHVLGLTLGTGLGAAWCAGGQAEDAALWDRPFKKGIAEDCLSTRWFLNRYFELTGIQIKGVKELCEAREYPIVVLQVFKEFGYNLAEFLEPIIKEMNVEVVVIGGNISNAYIYFLPHLHQIFKEKKIPVAINIAKLKEQASLIGAASTLDEEKQIFKR